MNGLVGEFLMQNADFGMRNNKKVNGSIENRNAEWVFSSNQALEAWTESRKPECERSDSSVARVGLPLEDRAT